MDILDDSENLDMPQTGNGREAQNPNRNLDLLPPVDPAPIPGNDAGQEAAEILNAGETDTS